MDTPDKPDLTDRPDPPKLAPGYSHLLMRDTRTPEEQLAASLKESARRKGRGEIEVVGEGGGVMRGVTLSARNSLIGICSDCHFSQVPAKARYLSSQ